MNDAVRHTVEQEVVRIDGDIRRLRLAAEDCSEEFLRLQETVAKLEAKRDSLRSFLGEEARDG